MLEKFQEKGAESKAQFDESYHDLAEKMKKESNYWEIRRMQSS
jgi:hypothetical protein